jgi:hypothetical protein
MSWARITSWSRHKQVFLSQLKKYRKNRLFAILFLLTDYLNPDKSTVYVIGGNVAFFRKAGPFFQRKINTFCPFFQHIFELFCPFFQQNREKACQTAFLFSY